LVEKAKESTEKSKLLKKNCDEISFAKENYNSPFLLSDRWLFFVADFYSVVLFFRRCA
jgi:hypothetical protein